MSDAQWYFGRDGAQVGPVSDAEIRRMLSAGQLRATDLVWRDGMGDWQPAGRVPELASAQAATVPPPLPPMAVAARPVQAGPYAPPPPPPYSASYGPPPAAPRDIGQDAGMRMLLPVGRSGWAIVAGYLGLFSFFPLLGIVTGIGAIITGFLAVSDIRKNPQKHGMGRAVFGIIAGILFVVVWSVVLVGVLASQQRQTVHTTTHYRRY